MTADQIAVSRIVGVAAWRGARECEKGDDVKVSYRRRSFVKTRCGSSSGLIIDGMQGATC